MKACRIHTHSSSTRAQECYRNMAGRRADKKILESGVLWQGPRYKMVKHSPPRVASRGGITYLVFSEDQNMTY
jgi:hypothetical protein